MLYSSFNLWLDALDPKLVTQPFSIVTFISSKYLGATIKPDVPTDELGLHRLCQVRVSALVAV
ncbi:hypothetical protein [Chroococcidiopsis sp. SAG 2025]|uniref:hypothetical protein n=1 Tax=Chroococcidiopsis sp. SAG 2025 TaxID=171389 RepID=UPI0011B1D1D2|nr:hypothetical protein [Chroococcidiopsis sp. SAG 2025]